VNNDREIKDVLREILKWTKVTSIPSVKNLLLDQLPSPEEKIAYHSSDGKTRKEVAKQAKVGDATISRWWKKWTRAGIAEAVPVRGGERAVRSFSLDDFGIEIPVREEATEKEGEAEKTT